MIYINYYFALKLKMSEKRGLAFCYNHSQGPRSNDTIQILQSVQVIEQNNEDNIYKIKVHLWNTI